MKVPNGREPVSVHLLGLEPGDRFTLSLEPGAPVYTVVDSTRMVDGEMACCRKALGPFGSLEFLGDVAARNRKAYFVFPVEEIKP